ncbi:MAG TPA: UDP-N-acetylmuramoyl-L-alanyl-D-glutamate--2,6-diaminopimelate ligase [Chitinophagales bacterium]|nr:UDP-N-acetylmuramoyl-L-alanyl-D-glutamate--2,6-diaminopimelate ligase [Chitinophagales bacterium]
MKKLGSILSNVSVVQIAGVEAITIGALQMDSRKVKSGDCFIAVKGTASDGHSYIDKCIEQGAVAIVCEVLPAQLNPAVTYVKVSSSAKALGQMASNFYDNPSARMKVVGVTGTNGKTSTVTLLFRLFRKTGANVGLLSTVQNQINEDVIPSTHTTPDAIALNALMKQMVDAGCSYCFMEVSSHAVDQRRIEGIQFTGAVFSNITHDHLDYHKTFENYLKAKKRFFDDLPATAFALVNADDRNGRVMLQNTRAKQLTYSLKTAADYKCKVIENGVTGLQLDLDGVEMHTRLIGEFNAYNLTAVYGVARQLGVEKEEALTILSALVPPEGRFDQLVSVNDKIVGIVDYAHTPDALKNVLQTIQAVRSGIEHVITVVGCGGDRDAAKRPVMAEIACRYSNKIILTSDNPRSEDPAEILRQMNEGVPVTDKKKVLTITDRREAIRTAVSLAGKGDIILLAGKGHEKYQEIKGVKNHFDDKEELMNCFKELEK